MMEAVNFSGMCVHFYQATWHHNLENSNFYSLLCENLVYCDELSFYRFRGNREGGVGENASYYVFTHASDGAIEAFPLQEWYKFQPIQRYKSLSAEEAEEQFGRSVLLASFLFDKVCKAGSSADFSVLPYSFLAICFLWL